MDGVEPGGNGYYILNAVICEADHHNNAKGSTHSIVVTEETLHLEGLYLFHNGTPQHINNTSRHVTSII